MVMCMQTVRENATDIATNYILSGQEIPYDFFETYFPVETKAYEELGLDKFRSALKDFNQESEEYRRGLEFLSCIQLNELRYAQIYENDKKPDTIFVDYGDTHISYPAGSVKK